MADQNPFYTGNVPKPDTNPFYEASGKAKKAVEDVTGAVLEGSRDFVGKVGSFAASILSTPKAAALHGIFGTKTPVEFSPTASQDQFREILGGWDPVGGMPPPVSAEGADILTDLPMAGALNAFGGKVAMPLLSRAVEPLRRVPGIKQASEFVSTGASLPKQFRQPSQRIMRLAEGEADLSAYQRTQRLGQFESLPADVQSRIANAIETKTIGTLLPDEQVAAKALVEEFKGQVGARAGAGLRPNELISAKGEVEPLGFVPRVLSKEGRVKRGLPPRGTPVGPPVGLATGKMPQRTEAGRKLTTEQMGLEGDVEPVVKAAFLRGAQNDTRVMHARIVDNLAKKFGQPAANEKESIAKHFGVLTGFDDAAKARLSKVKLPPEVDELVTNLNKRLQPEQFGELKNFWREWNQWWKGTALYSPGFVSRNVQNNIMQTAIYGNTDVSTYKRAWEVGRVMQGKGDGAKALKVGKRSMSMNDYIEDAIKRGVIGRGQIKQELGKGQLPGQEWLRKKAMGGEDISRAAFDLYLQGKGMDPMAAAEKVDAVLFNYSPRLQSGTKTALRRNAVPFINWSSNIVPLFVRQSIERPGSVGMAFGVGARQNERMGFGDPKERKLLGPDVDEQGGVVLSKKGGKARTLIPQFAGQYSINEYVPEKDREADALINQLYPQFQVPATLFYSKRDPFTGKAFDGSPQTAPAAIKSLWLIPGGKQFAAKHRIFIDKDGTVKAPDKLAYVLRNVPAQRLPSLLVDAVSPGKNSTDRLISFLTGVRTVERDPEIGRKIQHGKAKREARDKARIDRRYPQEAAAE